MEQAVHWSELSWGEWLWDEFRWGELSGNLLLGSNFVVLVWPNSPPILGLMSQNLNILGRTVTVSERTSLTAILSTWRWTNDQGHQPINNSHGIGHGFTVKYDSLLN